jgi:hypothetical protein
MLSVERESVGVDLLLPLTMNQYQHGFEQFNSCLKAVALSADHCQSGPVGNKLSP